MKNHLCLPVVVRILVGISFCMGHKQGNCSMGNNDVLYILKLMNLKPGSTLIIVQDNGHHADYADVLDTWMSDKDIQQVVIQMTMIETMFPSIMNQVMEKRALVHYTSVLNIVALCYQDCLPSFLKKLSKVDNYHGKSSLIRHFAKVLIIYLNEPNQHLTYTDTELDHLAIAFNGEELIVKTLFWTKEGRSWANIGHISDYKTNDIISDLFPNIHHGLNGRKLTIAAMEWVNFCRNDNRVHSGLMLFTHMCKDLTEYLAHKLNFTYVFVQPQDMTWGTKGSNSSWDGMLGMISRSEVDFSIIPFGRTLDRTRVLSFSSMLMTSSYKVVYLKAFSKTKDWGALVSGFKWDVYIIGLLTAVWCVLLTLVLETAVTKLNNRCRNLSTGRRTQMVFDTLGVALHRGSEYLPSSSSQRIFLVSWWFFCVIMTTVYTGNLIAFLAISKEIIPFRTLEELADNKEYRVFISDGSFLEDGLKNSHIPVHQKLWKRILESRTTTFTSSTKEISYLEEQLQRGKSAWISIGEQIEDTSQRVQPISRMHGEVMSFDMCLPFPLNSPLEPLISKQLLRMYDSGLLDGLRKKWLGQRPTMISEHHSASQLGINDFTSALAACAIGISLGCVSLAVERLCHNGIKCNWIKHFKTFKVNSEHS